MVRASWRAADQPYGGGEPCAVRDATRRRARGVAAPDPGGRRCFRRAALSAEEIRKSLELIIRYCAQQGLIPRAFTVDELFEGETQKLWSEAR